MTDNIMSLRRSGTTEVIQNVSCAFLNNNVADAHCVQVQREARKGLKPLVIRVEDLSLQSGLPCLRQILVEAMTIKKCN